MNNKSANQDHPLRKNSHAAVRSLFPPCSSLLFPLVSGFIPHTPIGRLIDFPVLPPYRKSYTTVEHPSKNHKRKRPETAIPSSLSRPQFKSTSLYWKDTLVCVMWIFCLENIDVQRFYCINTQPLNALPSKTHCCRKLIAFSGDEWIFFFFALSARHR